jgi:hypothetical protein
MHMTTNHTGIPTDSTQVLPYCLNQLLVEEDAARKAAAVVKEVKQELPMASVVLVLVVVFVILFMAL